MRLIVVAGMLLLLSALWGAPTTDTTLKPWRGWDKYQVIIHSTGSVKDAEKWFKQLTALGCTAEDCYYTIDPAPFIDGKFGFYVENMIPELAYLTKERQKLYDVDFNGYTSETGAHDHKFLLRKPCLDDLDFWKKKDEEVKQITVRFLPQDPTNPKKHPLLYDLRNEPSLGLATDPMDYCFAPSTLKAFRNWLQTQYPSLEALNTEWNTQYKTWDEVMPLTTYEIKERTRIAASAEKPENFASWNDFRAYMDVSFAHTLKHLRETIHELDPKTPVGIAGTQMPSAWGGYDLWRLSQAIDWAEINDMAGSRAIFRSFLPANSPVLSTVYGDDMNQISHNLWSRLLDGDRGCIIWDDEKSRVLAKEKDDMPLTDRGTKLAKVLAEIKKAAPAIFPLRRQPAEVAIHYSQASIRAHWMFESAEDEKSWPVRYGAYEAKHSGFVHVRDSVTKLITDLGLQSNFLSYEQLEKGDLAGYKVLVLPQSVAMSAKECRAVEHFVHAGGVVIADNMTATMDEHGKRLAHGQLDELFGINRQSVGWRAVGEAGTLADGETVFEPDLTVTTGKARFTSTPPEGVDQGALAIIERKVDTGRAIYLNLDLHSYAYDYTDEKNVKPNRLSATSLALRKLCGDLLKEAGVEAPITVVNAETGQPIPGVELRRYQGHTAFECVALLCDPDIIKAKQKVRLVLPQKKMASDLLTKENLEVAADNSLTLELDPWTPTIIKLQDPTP